MTPTDGGQYVAIATMLASVHQPWMVILSGGILMGGGLMNHVRIPPGHRNFFSPCNESTYVQK